MAAFLRCSIALRPMHAARHSLVACSRWAACLCSCCWLVQRPAACSAAVLLLHLAGSRMEACAAPCTLLSLAQAPNSQSPPRYQSRGHGDIALLPLHSAGFVLQ